MEKLLEDLIEVKEQTERDLTADGNRRARDEEKERAQAVEMRDRAMERFGETRKRGKGEDGWKGEKEEKKRRRSGSDTVEFLRAKKTLLSTTNFVAGKQKCFFTRNISCL